MIITRMHSAVTTLYFFNHVPERLAVDISGSLLPQSTNRSRGNLCFAYFMIRDFILQGALPWSFNLWFAEKLQSFWHAIEMKPTFRSVAVALALGAIVQADCPDFTTYSQVSLIILRRLSMSNTTCTSRARKAMPPQVHSLYRL